MQQYEVLEAPILQQGTIFSSLKDCLIKLNLPVKSKAGGTSYILLAYLHGKAELFEGRRNMTPVSWLKKYTLQHHLPCLDADSHKVTPGSTTNCHLTLYLKSQNMENDYQLDL